MALTQITCLECKAELGGDIRLTACPSCGSAWLDASYDYAAAAKAWAGGLVERVHSLWRYAELLPIEQADPEISMQEGFTPLIRLYQYEKLYDHPHIYVKDERQGPTNSFKDRQAALAVTALRQAGITECVLASAGNAGVAYAAYCARAGIKLWLFVSSLVPSEKMREAMLYGAEVVKVTGTYDEAKHVAHEFAARRGIHFDKGAKSIPGKESMKTLAFEIAEQLGLQQFPGENRWIAPDWYIQAVSGGIGPLGVWKGFQELLAMGLIDKLPKLGIVQSAGCAPMVQAFEQNREKAEPVTPKTLITVLSTGDPGFSYNLLREATLSNGGTMIAVEDGETFEAMRHVARRAGLSVEPAAAVAFAGLENLLQNGTIRTGESVVVNGSGHTFPVDSYILSDQYVLNLDTPTESPAEPIAEGLGTAFQHLDEQVTTILLVDDNASDRRLIRRLLQRYKHYRIYEARNGDEGLKMAREYMPDLVVTDLTMPETDGFTLLQTLKQHPATASIPVIVISAKSLNEQDYHLLQEHSVSVWMKGNFDTVQLADHVVRVLGDTPIEVIHPNSRERAQQPFKNQPDPALDHSYRIVVIDDNPRDLRLARRLLESNPHYQVLEANSGRDGLKMIYEHQPDLVLLDLAIPDMDGFTILEKMQNDDHLREIPVVIFSARPLDAEERDSLQYHIRAIIEKANVDRQHFLATIEKSLLVN